MIYNLWLCDIICIICLTFSSINITIAWGFPLFLGRLPTYGPMAWKDQCIRVIFDHLERLGSLAFRPSLSSKVRLFTCDTWLKRGRNSCSSRTSFLGPCLAEDFDPAESHQWWRVVPGCGRWAWVETHIWKMFLGWCLPHKNLHESPKSGFWM